MDIERIAVTYLRSIPAVAAITDRIGTRTPRHLDEPWARVQLLDDIDHSASRAGRLRHAYLQIDCYASANGGQSEAWRLSDAIRTALRGMPAATHTGAIVTGTTVTGLRPLPDTALEPARERYIVTVTVHAHPA